MKQICDLKIKNEIEKIVNSDLSQEKYMIIAHLASLNSLDPNSKTGACIVSKDGEVISIGWNAMPPIGKFPWEREGKEENTKYPYVVHAERMAIYNAIMDGQVEKLENASIYVNLFPCNQCMQQVAIYNLSALYYDSDKYHDSLFSKEARFIIKELKKGRKDGFICKQININKNILDNYKSLKESINEKVGNY